MTALLFGLLLAYWLNYGLYFVHSNLQWRFPLLFQCIFGVYIIAVTVWLPETPRWLMLHEATSHRGEIVLSKLRNKPTHHPDIIEEKNGILGAIELEHADDDGWLALFKDGGNSTNKRFYLSLGIMFMQETGGINMISYYAPTIFKESLGMSEERALFVGGFLQVWYLFASFLTVCPRVRYFQVHLMHQCVLIYASKLVVYNRSSWSSPTLHNHGHCHEHHHGM